MPLYEKHVFVCINERDPLDPRGCCAAKGSEAIREQLKDRVAAAGLKKKIRVNAAGCLDQCAHGVTVVVYPEAVWYGGVQLSDVDEIFESHLVQGRPVERLRLAHMRPADPS
jgi:(2Fe-2S) ferredoxin